jgi:hypothetical protein
MRYIFLCDVMMTDIPPWVYKPTYKHDNPVYEYDELKNELERITPKQFREHNKYMRSSEVMYV